MYFATTLFASLLVSANALATPHIGNGMHRRHQHAALAKVRAAAPEPVPQPLEASAAIPERRLRKRCQPRITSSASPTASSPAASSSAPPAPSSAPPPVNVAPAPAPKPSSSSSAKVVPPPLPPPLPTSSSPPAPAPSPSPSPSSSQAPAPVPSSNGGGGTQSNSVYTGTQLGADLTFYATGLGACGLMNNDSQFIAAVSEDLFDFVPGYNRINPNTNPICNKKVAITYHGKSVTVTITDRCTGCAIKSLDLSPAAFNVLADPSLGRLHDATWTWLS